MIEWVLVPRLPFVLLPIYNLGDELGHDEAAKGGPQNEEYGVFRLYSGYGTLSVTSPSCRSQVAKRCYQYDVVRWTIFAKSLPHSLCQCYLCSQSKPSSQLPSAMGPDISRYGKDFLARKGIWILSRLLTHFLKPKARQIPAKGLADR